MGKPIDGNLATDHTNLKSVSSPLPPAIIQVGIPISQKMNALICRPNPTHVCCVILAEIRPIDQQITFAEQSLSVPIICMSASSNLIDRVTSEDHYTQASQPNLMTEFSQPFCVRKWFPSEQSHSFDPGSCENLVNELCHRGRRSPVKAKIFRVATSGATQRAALNPKSKAAPGTLGLGHWDC